MSEPGLDLWRCMALVAVQMIDVPYAILTPDLPTAGPKLAGFYGTLAMELLYTPSWAL
jgi:hypothetical protein